MCSSRHTLRCDIQYIDTVGYHDNMVKSAPWTLSQVHDLIREDFEHELIDPSEREPLPYDDPVGGPGGLPGWLDRIATRLVSQVNDPEWTATQKDRVKLGWLAMLATLRGLEDFARVQGDKDVETVREDLGVTWLEVAQGTGYNSDRAARRRYLASDRESAAESSRRRYQKMSAALQAHEREQETVEAAAPASPDAPREVRQIRGFKSSSTAN